jgi:uncharacterized membrane protein
MVRLFKVRYWDYSYKKIQYKGHICLSSTIAWGFLSLLMVYVVHKPVERFIFWMHEDVVAVLTFAITVGFVYDFSNAFRQAMDLRKLLEQAEVVYAELEQRAAERKRVLEAAATFTKAAVEESLEEGKERLAQHVPEPILQAKDALIERSVSREATLRRLEIEQADLQKRQEQLKELLTRSARHLLLHNPGSRFASRRVDAGEIRERIRNLKQKIKRPEVDG